MTHAEVAKPTTPNLWNLTSPAEVAKVISFLLPVFAGLSITGTFSWLTAINAVLGIIGALGILHASANPYVKGGIAVLTAGLQALAVVLTGAAGLHGVTVQDWWTVVGAALGAVGVVYIPNKVVAAAQVGDVYNVTSLPQAEAPKLPDNPSQTPLLAAQPPIAPPIDDTL
jgi:uncharacterized membrane protein YqaE (UPF0057 family)